MMKPVRIQRKRTRGWRMPPNTLYVGRPTKWANPFVVSKFNGSNFKARRAEQIAHGRLLCLSNETAVVYFRECLERSMPRTKYPFPALPGGGPMDDKTMAHFQRIAQDIHELRGKNLACWCCEGEACHAGVLLEFANR